MKITSKTMIVGAAMAGLFTGTAARVHAAYAGTNAGTSLHKMDDATVDKHACAQGLNSCKGKGGCKSGDNGCKGKNSCKGKGGCATDGSKKITRPLNVSRGSGFHPRVLVIGKHHMKKSSKAMITGAAMAGLFYRCAGRRMRMAPADFRTASAGSPVHADGQGQGQLQRPERMRRGQARLRRQECLQGPGRLQKRRQRLQGQKFLQRQGRLQHQQTDVILE